MKSIGYKPEETFKKLDIAKIQLSEAINLFVQEKFICSLSLSSAAEEIYAGYLRNKGQRSVIEESHHFIQVIGNSLGLQIMQDMEKSESIAVWNRAKNRTKHHNKNESDDLTLNDCDEAYWMIKRGIANAKSLGILMENENEFDNWVIEKCCL
jgi:hypothetical protein